jgi:hypothetical protein
VDNYQLLEYLGVSTSKCTLMFFVGDSRFLEKLELETKISDLLSLCSAFTKINKLDVKALGYDLIISRILYVHGVYFYAVNL